MKDTIERDLAIADEFSHMASERIRELKDIIRELLSIVEDEGHADNYQPQVARARSVIGEEEASK